MAGCVLHTIQKYRNWVLNFFFHFSNSVSTDCSGGCGVQTNGDNSFGLSFNDKDGGW